METVAEILRKTADYFARKGMESPRREAELLLAHALGLKGRLDLYLQHDRPLTEETLDRLRGLVRQRAARVPWQHLLGEVPFHEIRLKVDARALIPRHETEELVERILRTTNPPPESILDLGTGTGAIALALAAALPQARVLAVDYSSGALALAAENRSLLPAGAAERVKLLKSDWFSSVTGTFDLIVSNPPYLTEEEWETAQPEVREHDPRSALVAADNGTADLAAIIRTAPGFLNPGGNLWLETGTDQHATLEALARSAGFTVVESLDDLTGRPRFLHLSGLAAGASQTTS